MPIVQISPSLEGPILNAQYPPGPEAPEVVRAWRDAKIPCEVQVFPAGYVGNVTPLRIREICNYLLGIDDTGEQGHLVLVEGSLPDQETPAETIDKARQSVIARADSNYSVAQIKTEGRKTAYISCLVGQYTLAIEGMIAHVTVPELNALRTYFPETPLPLQPEGM